MDSCCVWVGEMEQSVGWMGLELRSPSILVGAISSHYAEEMPWKMEGVPEEGFPVPGVVACKQ